MICPYCSSKTICVDSRQRGEIRWRRYSCRVCREQFETNEIVTRFDYAKINEEDRPKWRIVPKSWDEGDKDDW